MEFFSNKGDANGPKQEFEGSAGKGTKVPDHESRKPEQDFPGSAAKGKSIPKHESVKPGKEFGTK